MGCWPKGMKDVAPIIPDQGFKNYLTHRAIAYHNSRKKQEANGSI